MTWPHAPIEQIRAAACQLSGPVPYIERELASVLAVWLNSTVRRMEESNSEAPPDWSYAIEVAQLVLRRRLSPVDRPG
jgi:hypothetical protein